MNPIIDYTLRADEILAVPLIRNFRYRELAPNPPRRFKVSVEGDTFQQFLNPTARLNDNSVNGGALLLQTQLIQSGIDTAASVTVLSTHDLVHIQYNAADDQIWQCTHGSQYWATNTWVLPIHRRESHHWVLCIIYLDKKQLHFFDSFAEERPWHSDLNMYASSILCTIDTDYPSEYNGPHCPS